MHYGMFYYYAWAVIISAFAVLCIYYSKAFDMFLYRLEIEYNVLFDVSDILGQKYILATVQNEYPIEEESENDAFVAIYRKYNRFLISNFLNNNWRFRGRFKKKHFFESTMLYFLNDQRSHVCSGKITIGNDLQRLLAYKIVYALTVTLSSDDEYGKREISYAKNELDEEYKAYCTFKLIK